MPFTWKSLPESEREAGRLLARNVTHLTELSYRFEQAVALVDFCDAAASLLQPALDAGTADLAVWQAAMGERFRYKAWREIAARDGAITLYNFMEVKQAIDGLLGMCPSVAAKIDREQLRCARRTFEDRFAGVKDIRFGVAHAGAPFSSPEENAKHRVYQEAELILTGSLAGREFHVTMNGRHVFYVLDRTSWEALDKSASEIFYSFRAVVGG